MSLSLYATVLAMLAGVLARPMNDYHNDSSCSANSYIVVPNNGSGIWPYRQYKSSNATPSELNISTNGQTLAPGLIFYDPGNAFSPGIKAQGPMIITSDSDLVWSGPNTVSSTFVKQTLFSKPVASYWIPAPGTATSAEASHGYGSVQILDEQYKLLYNVCPYLPGTQRPGSNVSCVADPHESYITANNTMLVTVYNTTQADLTSVGGPKTGWVLDPLAVEVDIKTNAVLWSWSPLAHVPINTTHLALGTTGTNASNPFDWFHTNSIQSFRGGYLINSRQTWTSYYVDRAGKIDWELNGATGGSFGPLPAGGRFAWEHHARLHEYGHNSSIVLYTTFNDDNSDFTTQNPSTAIALVLELPPNKAKSPTLYSRLTDPTQPLAALAEGSYSLLANGSAFIGYGEKPFMKEYGSDGRVRWSAQFGYNNNNNTAQSYRAFKQEWHATPDTPLDVVVQQAAAGDSLNGCAMGSTLRGYVSWNGATDVVHYTILTGESKDCLEQSSVVRKMGFETEFVVPQDASYVQVIALDGQGHELGASAVVESH